MELIERVLTGLGQGDVASVIIVAVIALLVLFLFAALFKLGAALVRVGCLVIVMAIFIYAVSRLLGSP